MMKWISCAYIAMIIYAKVSGALVWSWWIVLLPLYGWPVVAFAYGFVFGLRKAYAGASKTNVSKFVIPGVTVTVADDSRSPH